MVPASSTKLPPILIDRGICDLCGACVAVCAPDSIAIDHALIRVDGGSCTRCMKCVPACPVTAISGGVE
jgi:ferredoxin